MGIKRVGIVAHSADETAQGISNAVRQRGGAPIIWDTTYFPESSLASLDNTALSVGDVVLDDLRCFYVKSLPLTVPIYKLPELRSRAANGWPAKWVATRERFSFLASALGCLDDGTRTFVNSMHRIDIHSLKPQQMCWLARAGVRVPETLTTNDGEAVKAFVAKHRSVVFKPLGGGALVVSLIDEDLTTDRLKLLRLAPVTFQERIVGREFRVYVLAGQVIGAFETPTDTYADARYNLSRAQPVQPPEAVCQACIRAAAVLSLTLTAVDVRLDEQGPAVLDCNPTASIADYQPIGGPIFTHVAEYLLAHA